MEWTDAKVYSLIDAYEKRPSLYDFRSELYHNRIVKVKAWQEVANSCETTVAEVQKKMKNLRTQFVKESKRYIRSGSAADDAKKWKHFQSLMFLQPFTTMQAMTVSNLPRGPQDELCDGTAGDDEQLEMTQQQPVTAQEPEVTTPSASASMPNASTSTPSASYSKSTSSRKRRQSDFDVQYIKSMESLEQLIKSPIENQKAAIPDDEDDIFGKIVACACRKIKNPKIKRQLTKKISDLLYEAAEEDEANVENLPQYIILQPNPKFSEQ